MASMSSTFPIAKAPSSGGSVVPHAPLPAGLKKRLAKLEALFEVLVDVYDEHGTHALTAVVEWFVAKIE